MRRISSQRTQNPKNKCIKNTNSNCNRTHYIQQNASFIFISSSIFFARKDTFLAFPFDWINSQSLEDAFTLGLIKFGPGKLLVDKVWAQSMSTNTVHQWNTFSLVGALKNYWYSISHSLYWYEVSFSTSEGNTGLMSTELNICYCNFISNSSI